MGAIYGHLVPGGNRAAVDKLDGEVPAIGKATQEAVEQIESGSKVVADWEEDQTSGA